MKNKDFGEFLMTEIKTPDWVKNAVFYQIFPDRFARSNRVNHPAGLKFSDWNSNPTEKSFHGGDIYGIIDKLEYLSDLGINAIYMNPIFASTSNHRYNAYDFFKVDPLLGGDDALRDLIFQAHEKGIRIILDAALNHTGRGFWQFNHILENGANSPYIDWFIIHDWPLRPYSNNPDEPINYEAWWGYPELPKLNTNNPVVQDYLFEVTKHWMGFGIDGWRIDVPMEITAVGFWEKYRSLIKSINPEAYIVGEVWTEAKEWLQGDRFDGVMNYMFANNSINFFGSKTLNLTDFTHDLFKIEPFSASQFGKNINEMIDLYDWAITSSQLNLLDSHDMPRALWLMGEDKSALKLAVLFQMTMPGAPCIYYGDEIGLSSAADPHCRGTFPWNQKDKIDSELFAYYKNVIEIRMRNQVLRIGDFQEVFSDHGIYSFIRTNEDEHALIIINTNDKFKSLDLNNIGKWSVVNIWKFPNNKNDDLEVDKKIKLSAREGIIIFMKGQEKQVPTIKINY